MPRFAIALLGTAALSSAAMTADSRLICFGNEPSWSVELTAPGIASVTIPDEELMSFRGSMKHDPVLRESLWRGSTAAGRELVVFLRDATCSDGMSDTRHPVTARVSLPDLRFFAGCCRVPAKATSARSSFAGGS